MKLTIIFLISVLFIINVNAESVLPNQPSAHHTMEHLPENVPHKSPSNDNIFYIGEYDFPPQLLISYPPSLQQVEVGGTIVLEIDIDEKGNVKNTKILKSIVFDSEEIEERVMNAAKASVFSPALYQGDYVPSIIRMTYHIQ